mmetsp:Transcript_110247/g.322669  ORF Transcript_110247/g.322669 Transcript_110247/m.322669 type:complete len:307 (+) Transcript_110247:266-1186(+)
MLLVACADGRQGPEQPVEARAVQGGALAGGGRDHGGCTGLVVQESKLAEAAPWPVTHHLLPVLLCHRMARLQKKKFMAFVSLLDDGLPLFEAQGSEVVNDLHAVLEAKGPEELHGGEEAGVAEAPGLHALALQGRHRVTVDGPEVARAHRDDRRCARRAVQHAQLAEVLALPGIRLHKLARESTTCACLVNIQLARLQDVYSRRRVCKRLPLKYDLIACFGFPGSRSRDDLLEEVLLEVPGPLLERSPGADERVPEEPSHFLALGDGLGALLMLLTKCAKRLGRDGGAALALACGIVRGQTGVGLR